MVTWLKELSLFDHFLQGLFKYLSEDSNKSTDLAGDCCYIEALRTHFICK